MIAAAGILSKAELATMTYGLDQVQSLTGIDEHAIVKSAPDAEDIHHFVELQLTKVIGDLALKLHTGRSRNEQIATDMRLFESSIIDAIDCGSTVKGSARMGPSADRRGRRSRRGGHPLVHASAACRAGAGCALAAGVRQHD